MRPFPIFAASQLTVSYFSSLSSTINNRRSRDTCCSWEGKEVVLNSWIYFFWSSLCALGKCSSSRPLAVARDVIYSPINGGFSKKKDDALKSFESAWGHREGVSHALGHTRRRLIFWWAPFFRGSNGSGVPILNLLSSKNFKFRPPRNFFLKFMKLLSTC